LFGVWEVVGGGGMTESVAQVVGFRVPVWK
jgi:hypothetical protein